VLRGALEGPLDGAEGTGGVVVERESRGGREREKRGLK